MKQLLSTILISCLLMTSTAFGAGKIQGADVKTETELISAGATKAQMIKDSQIYVTANGINDKMSSAISSGLLGGLPSWVTATVYTIGQAVSQNNRIYKCLAAHTSGTFVTDLTASRWVELSAADMTVATGVLPLANGGTGNTSGTATINANLTGPITSAGNATSITNASIDAATKLTGITPIANGGTGSATQNFVNETQGVEGSAVATTKITAPANQFTTTATGVRHLETGNSNVLKDPSAEAITTSWTVYKNTAVAALPDVAMGGTISGNLTVSNSVSSPLSGAKSLVLVKTGLVNLQGEGIKIPFTIPASSKFKVNRLNFDYGIVSGTYADGEIQFFVKDVTNGKIIPFTPSKLLNHTLTSEAFNPNGEFQASDSVSYELIAHIAGTSALNYTLKFDNFKLGIYEKTYGSAVTDWVSFTPTGTWTTNTTYLGKYRKVGDSMEVMVTTTLSGAPNNASLYIDLPSGFTIDTTKIGNTAVLQSVFGSASINDAGARNYTGSAVYLDSNSVAIIYTELNNNGVVDTVSPITFGSGDSVSVSFKVPIVGWSSSQVVSSDADTRVVATKVHTSGTSFTGAGGVVTAVFSGVENDSHGTYSISTGFYIVPVTGFYRVSATLTASVATGTAAAGNANIMHLQKAGVNYATMAFYTAPATTPALQRALTGTALGYFIAGDQLKITVTNPDSTWSGLNNSTGTWASFERLSGPSQIMASESVSALYTGAPPTGTLGAASNLVTFGTKVKDSHNLYASGLYPVSSSGVYDVSAALRIIGTFSIGQIVVVEIAIDGVTKYQGYWYAQAGLGAFPATPNINVKSIPLLAGQTISIRSYAQGTSLSFAGDATTNHFSLTRSGQY